MKIFREIKGIEEPKEEKESAATPEEDIIDENLNENKEEL